MAAEKISLFSVPALKPDPNDVNDFILLPRKIDINEPRFESKIAIHGEPTMEGPPAHRFESDND